MSTDSRDPHLHDIGLAELEAMGIDAIDDAEWEGERRLFASRKGRRSAKQRLRQPASRPARSLPGPPRSRIRGRRRRRPAFPPPHRQRRRRPRIVRRGAPCICPAHGEEFVRWVQSSLNHVLGRSLPVNGVMTRASRDALRDFQRERGLTDDGIAGPETERALTEARRAGAPAEAAPPGDGQLAGGEPPAEQEPAAPSELEMLMEDGELEVGDWSQKYPASVRKVIAQGAILWPLAMQRAIEAGIRNSTKLADLAFFMHYPERNGRPISTREPGAGDLIVTWKLFRDAAANLLRSPSNPSGGSTAPARPAATTDWVRVPLSERRRYVMRLLVDTYGYPENGAAGIVGNLSAESSVLPNRVEGSRPETPMRAADFDGRAREFTAAEVINRDLRRRRGPRRPGVGLAQWTSSRRRSGLFRHAFGGRVLGADILSNMDAQVDYLVNELRSRYAGVDRVLRKPHVSLNDASDEVLFRFEVPGVVLNPAGGRRRRDDPAVVGVRDRRRGYARSALADFRGR